MTMVVDGAKQFVVDSAAVIENCANDALDSFVACFVKFRAGVSSC